MEKIYEEVINSLKAKDGEKAFELVARLNDEEKINVYKYVIINGALGPDHSYNMPIIYFC